MCDPLCCDPCCCLPGVPCFCAMHVCRYRPCCAPEHDVLLFGDSSLDMLRVTPEFTERPVWAETVDRFSAAGFRLHNMACGAAPAFQLCCASPCFLCRAATRPTSAIVASMGGNDPMLPIPLGNYGCCPMLGICCPCEQMLAFDCFMRQLSCAYRGELPIRVIWLNDIVHSEYIGPNGPVVGMAYGYCVRCTGPWEGYEKGTDRYRRYCKSVRAQAGVVISPTFEEAGKGHEWLDVHHANDPAASASVPKFSYSRSVHEGAAHPNLIYIDEEALVTQVKAEMLQATYAKLFGVARAKDDPVSYDGTEGEASALMKAMWTEWMLHVVATELKQPTVRPMLMNRDHGHGNKVVPS